MFDCRQHNNVESAQSRYYAPNIKNDPSSFVSNTSNFARVFIESTGKRL